MSVLNSASDADKITYFKEIFKTGGVVNCPAGEKYKYIHLSVNN